MDKIHKMISLPSDVAVKLSKEPNMSKLIVDLLNKHYNVGKVSKDELIKKLTEKKEQEAKLNKEITELESKLTSLEQYSIKVKEIAKNTPEWIVNDMIGIPESSNEDNAFHSRFKELYEDNCENSEEELREIFVKRKELRC